MSEPVHRRFNGGPLGEIADGLVAQFGIRLTAADFASVTIAMVGQMK